MRVESRRESRKQPWQQRMLRPHPGHHVNGRGGGHAAGVGMAGRGSPAKSAGSARPKIFFWYFRNLRVKLCCNPSVRNPGLQLDFGRPGRPASPCLGIFPAVSGRSYRLAGPAGHINLGRQVCGRVRPEVGPGRPIVARPEDGKLCGRRRPGMADDSFWDLVGMSGPQGLPVGQ